LRNSEFVLGWWLSKVQIRPDGPFRSQGGACGGGSRKNLEKLKNRRNSLATSASESEMQQLSGKVASMAIGRDEVARI
jgi:hypothetical protein